MVQTRKKSTTKKRLRGEDENEQSECNNTNTTTTTTTTTSSSTILLNKDDGSLNQGENTDNEDNNNDADDSERNSKKKLKLLSGKEKIISIFDSLQDGSDKLQVKEFQGIFESIANKLQNEVLLMVNKEPYILGELEFYCKSKNHPDSFTHGDIMQKDPYTWYFHRNGGTYKSGTYKGLDITFGSRELERFGGILIRSVYPLNLKNNTSKSPEKTLIQGPSLTVDEILKQTGYKDIVSFVNENGRSIFQEDNEKLYIVPRDDVDLTLYKVEEPIYQKVLGTARVGLTFNRYFKNSEFYLARNYRFVRFPIEIKKGKVEMIVSLIAKNESNDSIKKQTNSRVNNIEKIRDNFNLGKKLTTHKTLIGDLTSEKLAKALGYATILKYQGGDTDEDKEDEVTNEAKEEENNGSDD